MNSYPKVVPPSVWTIFQQRNESERFLVIKLEPKSNGNPSKNVWERVWVSVWAWESSTPLSRPLFKENERRHAKRGRPQWSGDRWCKWGLHNGYQGSADLGVRPTHWWARCCSPLAVELQRSYGRWPWGARPEFCSKRCPNYFSKRILKFKKYFWYFCKKGKVLEKFQHVENNFENFKHAVGKSNELKEIEKEME